MNANFSKYPAEDRVKEMSKQEEILLKRKREIERRLCLQESGTSEGGGAGGGGGGDKPLVKYPRKQFSTSPYSSSGESSSPRGAISQPPVAKYGKKQVPSSSSSSDGAPVRHLGRGMMSGALNKFSNDGSFYEQFKKMTEKQKAEVKEEKPSPAEVMKVAAKQPKPSSKVPLPKLKHPAFFDDGQDAPDVSDTKIKTEFETKDEMLNPLPVDQEGNQDPNDPDWFKEALRKVQEKARQLNAKPSAGSSEDSVDAEAAVQSKKRRSRWAETPVEEPVIAAAVPIAVPPQQPVVNLNVPDNLMTMVGEGEHIEAIRGVMVTRITRNSPAIFAYAHKVFGSTDLTEAQWKQCEEQMKMNVVFQLLQAKQREAERLKQRGKVKFEYDSDEDTEGGTWEHKMRAKEMAETQSKAIELTCNAEGKHHIGDFLPPDELARFMEKYRALKEGRDPDLSDYQEHKLTEDNIGYKMLKSMGWTEGMGLGAEGKGITAPVNQSYRNENQGLGVERPDNLSNGDDEYDAYRKRMMLAYRFRPNPLNNPRRAYY